LEFQSGSPISITAMLQVRLKEEALDLAAFDLLLRLDQYRKLRALVNRLDKLSKTIPAPAGQNWRSPSGRIE
jgi:hypothetical protein